MNRASTSTKQKSNPQICSLAADRLLDATIRAQNTDKLHRFVHHVDRSGFANGHCSWKVDLNLRRCNLSERLTFSYLVYSSHYVRTTPVIKLTAPELYPGRSFPTV